MSSDPNRPNPDWWKPAPKGSQDNPDYQDPYADQGRPTSAGYPRETRAYPPGDVQYPQAGSGYPQSGSGYPQSGSGYPQAGSGYPATPAAHSYEAPPRTRRRRRKWPLITLIVIVLILVAADRAAAAITENQMASQVQSSLDLSGKPHVSIQGFPFLTQLAARDFSTVDVNATDETTGPLEISSLTATLHGMHIHGLNSATIDQFSASALINFAALGKVGGIPQGVTLSADGSNMVKADISVGPLSDTAVAEVTKSGASQINVKIIKAGGIPVSLLGSLANFNVNIPKLPAGVSISSVSVTQQGVLISATGQNTTLSQ